PGTPTTAATFSVTLSATNNGGTGTAALTLTINNASTGNCHVVTPTGSGAMNGSDWNNAFAGLPATLVRGDTYYMASGNYPGYRFRTPESGTAPITIKKAVPTDQCTAAGWQASFGVGQAVWTTAGGSASPPSGPGVWQFSDSGFWVLDGNGRTGRKSGHG